MRKIKKLLEGYNIVGLIIFGSIVFIFFILIPAAMCIGEGNWYHLFFVYGIEAGLLGVAKLVSVMAAGE